MTITESNDVNTVLQWAMGMPQAWAGHPSDAAATEAAKRLAEKAYKALSAGLRPGEVLLNRAHSAGALQRIQAAIDVARRTAEREAGQ